MNSPGSPVGSHGSATASKMACSLNLIEPNWFSPPKYGQNANAKANKIISQKIEDFISFLLFLGGFQKSSNTEDVIRPVKRFRPFIT